MKKAALLALLLSGCQTAEERLASDDTTCKSYGVAPGSAPYVQCRMNLDRGRADIKASEQFGRGSSLSGFIQRAGER